MYFLFPRFLMFSRCLGNLICSLKNKRVVGLISYRSVTSSNLGVWEGEESSNLRGLEGQ